MRINITSVMVDDQDKALKFYTEILGFVKKYDVPVGEYRWITLTSTEGTPDVELALEPNAHPAAKVFQKALHDDGIPLTSFASANIQAEYEKLKNLGVVFRQEPTAMGPVTIAMFDDTCGNLIQLAQYH
jgi:catechol 2,3-dioxygenase-like lactoylglutathione lyase family enzyme